MPASDREVFERLTADPDTERVNDLLTYAIYANEKQEWLKHFDQLHDRPAEQAEINEWIRNLPDWRYGQMREEASQFFEVAARALLRDEVDLLIREAADAAVVREVKAAGGFWRQLFFATVTAVLAPIILGLVLVAVFGYERLMPTAGGMSGRAPPVEQAR